jgi:beta-galactosidase GanA
MPDPVIPLYIGATWQPEAWPEDQWALDIARMKEVGINCVRLFEFAWHRFEPREWEFDCQWAVQVLDQLRDAGISAVVATPTAAPPEWMVAKYPDILQVTPEGHRTVNCNGRRYSVVSSRYREFCSRIIDQMVHAFRGHEAVVGWQIDHEMTGADYGNEARRAFHTWLSERFGEVESLNKKWGLEQGSRAYEYFEQVPIPPVGNVGHAPLPVAARHHPSLMIAFQRFINDQWSSFIQTQCEVVRSGFDKPLSTNMAPDWRMNYFRQNHLLDRVGMSLGAGAGDLSKTLMHLDRMRAEKPGVPFWLLGSPAGGRAVEAIGWLSTLMGSELIVFDSWRQAWSGRGMSAGGVVSATGRWTRSKEPLEKLASQLKSQSEYLAARPPVEARLGVVMSNESAWAFSIEPPEADFAYEEVWRDEFYLPIAQTHFWRDVIDQSADFCPYQVLILPLVPMLHRPTRDRLKEWVEGGGCLLIGPLTGYRTEEFTAPTEQEFSGLEDLMGATCTGSFSIEPGDSARILWGDPAPAISSEDAAEPVELPSSTPRGLCHAFIPTAAHVLARYNGNGVTDAAIIMNKVGQGTVITLGARVDRDSYLDLVHTLCELVKIEPLATGSPNVAVIPRMNADTTIAAYGLVNLSTEPQTITLPKAGLDRLSGRALGPEIDLDPHQVILLDLAE